MASPARRALLLGCATVLLALAPKAHALGLHGYAPCPYGGPGEADGCTGSNVGNLQDPNWRLTAIENGTYAPNLQAVKTFNLPSIDYQDGYNPSTVVAASANTNPGCVYAATGAGPSGAYPQLTCGGSGHSITNGAASDIDWTNGDTTCVYGVFGSGVTGVFTGDNWKAGGCPAGTGDNFHQFTFAFQDGPLTTVNITHLGVDGSCPTCAAQPLKDLFNSNARHVTFNFDHIAVKNLPNRFADLFNDNWSLKHFYIKDINLGYAVSGDHGEFIFANYDTGTSGWTAAVAYGAVTLSSANLAGGTITAPFYFTNGLPDATISLTPSADHVLFITNPAASDGSAVAGRAAWEVSGNTFPSASFTNIWIYAGGANYCSLGGSGSGSGFTSPTFASVINLFNNTALTGYDTTPCAGHR